MSNSNSSSHFKPPFTFDKWDPSVSCYFFFLSSFSFLFLLCNLRKPMALPVAPPWNRELLQILRIDAPP